VQQYAQLPREGGNRASCEFLPPRFVSIVPSLAVVTAEDIVGVQHFEHVETTGSVSHPAEIGFSSHLSFRHVARET